MDLNGLISDSWFVREWAIERREVSSLLMHAFTPITHIFHPHSWFSIFLSLTCFSLFSLFSFSLFPFFGSFLCSCLLCTSMALLYYLPWQDLPLLPLNHFWPIVGVLPRLHIGLLVAQPLPLHCVGCATPYSQTKVVLFCFVFYFPWYSHPDKGWTSPSSTSIVCT